MSRKSLLNIKTISKGLSLILCSLLMALQTYAQDTILVKTYSLPEKITNIDGDGRNLIVRTDNHLYKLVKEFAESKSQVLVCEIANKLLADFQVSTLT